MYGFKIFSAKNCLEIKEHLFKNSAPIKPPIKPNEAPYLHKPKIVEDKKIYEFLPSEKIIKIIDDEIIRIARGSNLNKPEVQFQFHNVLNKRNFFQEVEKDNIKKGAIIKLENIELEYK